MNKNINKEEARRIGAARVRMNLQPVSVTASRYVQCDVVTSLCYAPVRVRKHHVGS